MVLGFGRWARNACVMCRGSSPSHHSLSSGGHIRWSVATVSRATRLSGRAYALAAGRIAVTGRCEIGSRSAARTAGRGQEHAHLGPYDPYVYGTCPTIGGLSQLARRCPLEFLRPAMVEALFRRLRQHRRIAWRGVSYTEAVRAENTAYLGQ